MADAQHYDGHFLCPKFGQPIGRHRMIHFKIRNCRHAKYMTGSTKTSPNAQMKKQCLIGFSIAILDADYISKGLNGVLDCVFILGVAESGDRLSLVCLRRPLDG